jgi:hypothetical protein
MGYQTHKAAIAALARMAATGQPTRGSARSSLLRLGLCLGAILLLGLAITLPPQTVSAGIANFSKVGSALDSPSPLLTPVKSKGKGKAKGKGKGKYKGKRGKSAVKHGGPHGKALKSSRKKSYSTRRVHTKKVYSSKRYRKGYARGKVVVVRPVRRWYRKPYYGNFFAGVALGTILGVTAVGIAPVAPSSDLCWYWSDSYMNRGYWDYCY